MPAKVKRVGSVREWRARCERINFTDLMQSRSLKKKKKFFNSSDSLDVFKEN